MPIGFHEEGAYRHAILAQKQFAAARISLTFRSPDLSPTSPWTPLTYPAPRVFCMKAGHAYPKDAEYVGCKTTRGQVREGTVFGNALDPLKRRGVVLENGRKNEHIAGEELPPEKREAKFRAYAMEKLKDPAFRREAEKLRGKHLLCWCVQNGQKRSEFCHARVWLDLVNNLPVVTGEGRKRWHLIWFQTIAPSE